MAITKPNMSFIWASGGATIEPSDIKKQTGWTAEVPPYQWENWIQNRQDEYLAHINQYGVPVWDSFTEYQANKSYVQGPTNGIIYRCNQTNVNQNPELDLTGVYWTVALELATTSEAQSFINNTKFISPLRLKDAFNGSNSVKNSAGYQKYPNGLILQWGIVTQSTGSAAVPFSVTFPNAALQCVVSNYSDAAVFACYQTLNQTGFSVQTYLPDGASTSVPISTSYLAIGY